MSLQSRNFESRNFESRNFELHHPWLFIFGSVCGFVLLLGLCCLPVWGWIELRFSPLQRHYLVEYLQSSVGVVAGSGPEYVEWIKKKGPDGKWETAGPADVVPTEQAYPPFQLSPSALAQEWIDLGYNTDGSFDQRDIRDTLQAVVFDGHSLLYFVLQPFELLFVGLVCFMSFNRWREQQARQRGARWGAGPRYVSWDEDLAQLAKQLAQETRVGAVQTWRWVQARQQSLRQPGAVAMAGASVSPSLIPSTVTPAPSPKPVVRW